MNWDVSSFKEKIENEHTFPGEYLFKFIVPKEKKEEVEILLPDGEFTYKKSSGDKYVSVTIKAVLSNSSEVIDVYEKAHHIDGIVAL